MTVVFTCLEEYVPQLSHASIYYPLLNLRRPNRRLAERHSSIMRSMPLRKATKAQHP